MKETIKSLSLPKPIAAYFTADSADGEAVSQCFTENAVVRDEEHTHSGRAAIKKWKMDTSARYQYTSEPFACEEKDGTIVVTSHLVGNFPGIPLTFDTFSSSKGTRLRGWKSSRERYLSLLQGQMAPLPAIYCTVEKPLRINGSAYGNRT